MSCVSWYNRRVSSDTLQPSTGQASDLKNQKDEIPESTWLDYEPAQYSLDVMKARAWKLDPRKWQPVFLDALSRLSVANSAAKVAGILLHVTVYYRQKDPVFRGAYDAALEQGKQEREGQLLEVAEGSRRGAFVPYFFWLKGRQREIFGDAAGAKLEVTLPLDHMVTVMRDQLLKAKPELIEGQVVSEDNDRSV